MCIRDRAKALGMNAIAITDHGNMYGVKNFHDTATDAGVKPILGCEVYVVKNRFEKGASCRSLRAWVRLSWSLAMSASLSYRADSGCLPAATSSRLCVACIGNDGKSRNECHPYRGINMEYFRAAGRRV